MIHSYPFLTKAVSLSILLSTLMTVRVLGDGFPSVSDNPKQPGFNLVLEQRAADLCIDPGDAKVVKIAADCLSGDIERITGMKPRITTDPRGLSENTVLIGTVGKSALIDGLIQKGKLVAKGIQGKWESFVVETVTDPLPGVHKALVIAGSDRRGTAFGVFSLCEAIGVSPWVWWADVAPSHRDTLIVGPGPFVSKPPSVKYRGIFINDEDWGLQPWAAKTFEPETGDIGPKTYAKVFELLLRLKANYIWPAMHKCTKPFNQFPENRVVADHYAIVMGSSHAEPMLRNNVREWTGPKEDWNYEKNPDGVKAYWEQRVRENGAYENSYTVGMRGIHDNSMPGGSTSADKVAILQRVIADQRAMLAQYANPKVEQVPQIFVPYKEVLLLYQNGLKVPDDVTLVWPDDNHGYLRQLSNPVEQKRSGGAGVYYHLSYWGKPEDYLWLCTVPPALIWEEMSKAYDYGARTVWVANVGDIKPGELGMEFFLRMAWDITPWNENAQLTFLKQWAERDFGKEQAGEIAAIMDEYYRLNQSAKPEHMQEAKFTSNYNEIGQRLQRFSTLVAKANSLYEKLPAEKRDGFYEMVVYPVRCSALMNVKHLSPSLEQGQTAHEQIQAETKYFNEGLLGGKWRYVMSANPRDRAVYQKLNPGAKRATEDDLPAALASAKNSTISSIEAEHPTRKTDAGEAKWKVIPGLGRTGDSVALLPTTATIPDAATLEYRFSAAKAGPAKVLVYCLPTHATYPGKQLRYSTSIDGEPPKVVSIDTREFSAEWSTNVLRAAAIGISEHSFASTGTHLLKIHPLDPGVVFDKIVIDQGELKPSHLGPPETVSR